MLTRCKTRLCPGGKSLQFPRSNRRWISQETRKAAGDLTGDAKTRARIDRINARLPRFLRRYTTALANAPVSHISAFLILHELTAIVPLVGLAATFHYTGWLPRFLTEGAWVSAGIEKFGRYFKRKGWIDGVDIERDEESQSVEQAWTYGEGGTKIVIETAAAWAVVKALLPLRIMLSVYATPWFARFTVVPLTRGVSSIFGRANKLPTAVAGAGTRSIAGETLPAKRS